ncbi:potassium/proton antiporter [Teredinibacter turnerae]|uniref:potassium/proton antiporter n=1 Tax=Teredinibacter turnerae TaxID=2426 RepID=UPI000382D3CF|nr:potassium/proton antiporter [Teredinibacter turnerae]
MIIELIYQHIFGASLLALLCIVVSVFTQRIGAPILLVFLILGMLAGEDGPGKIDFNDFRLAFLFGNIALAIIIFDGGLGTKASTFRVSLKPALSLATLGVVATAGITGYAVRLILELPWKESLLIGAIVASTDAAAVFGLLRGAGLEIKKRTGATLEIESGSNDPMAIFLTMTLVQIMQIESNGSHAGMFLLALLRQMGLGLIMGFAGGALLAQLLKRLPLPASLYPLLALAGAVCLFGFTTLLDGSGFLAIFIAGALIGNTPLTSGSGIQKFHNGLAWLSQIGMFLMLGLLITPSQLLPLVLPALAIAFVLIFIARPIAVVFALLPFRFPWREQIFISWCGLRGAVPIILALFPSLAGLENTQTYFELVFFVVLVSLIIQGWTIAPVARWLKLEVPPADREPEYIQVALRSTHKNVLTVYPVTEKSNAAGVRAVQLPIPGWAQLMGVIRDGRLLDRTDQAPLQADDQVVFLIGNGSRAKLHRVFSPAGDNFSLSSSHFLGQFTLSPTAPLAEVGAIYGFSVKEEDKSKPLEAYILSKCGKKPVVGDKTQIGSVELVVREVVGNRISAVGLKLPS